MNKQREDILRRIRLLRERTVERGCTEAEAMAAAELASKLLAEHDLTLTEVELKEVELTVEDFDTGRLPQHVGLSWVLVPLGEFTDTMTRVVSGEQTRERDHWRSNTTSHYQFFGTKPDAETAAYLLQVIYGAMEREVREYLEHRKRIGQPGGVRARNAFLVGMGSRIASRLTALRKQRDAVVKPTGRDLVVLKNQLIVQSGNKLGFDGETRSTAVRTHDTHASLAGHAAGDRVSFNKGVGERDGTQLIGRRS